MSQFKIYAKSILIPVGVGLIIGAITSSSIEYNTLIQPVLAPPSILFPIVWTILYVLMGISYGRLKSKNLVNSEINFIYYLQLFVNALWSIIFFTFKWRLFAFFWLLVLILLVVREDKVNDVLETLKEKFEKIKNGKGIAYTIPLQSVIGASIYQFMSNNKTMKKEEKSNG